MRRMHKKISFLGGAWRTAIALATLQHVQAGPEKTLPMPLEPMRASAAIKT
jgi:hypothetical protein